jgi:hypothetical protein
MWTQVVGKLCLALTAPVNHYWNVAFRVTARGLSTPTLAAGSRALNLSFDLVDHRLLCQASDGRTDAIALEPRPVSDFYHAVMHMLRRMGVDARIWTMPVEVPSPIRFEDDTVHASYDASAANAFLRVLLAVAPVFERFRGGFLGKCSPLHFFWGSFDLALSRFSGRRAPERPGADAVTRESYSHEVISAGFWPGSGAVQEPAFYAYAAPQPAGLEAVRPRPEAAFYSKDLSEFILPYEAVRSAADPVQPLMAFLTSTYEAAAELGGWERAVLERH